MRLQLQRLVNIIDNADSELSVWNCGVVVAVVGFLFILSLSVFSIL